MTYVHVTRNLTGKELYRLLVSGRLSSRVLAELWAHEGEVAGQLDEMYGEQLAEYGRAVRHYSRLEAYMRANPIHTCAPKPAGWGLEDDDLPF